MTLFTDPLCSMHQEEHLNFNKQLLSLFQIANGHSMWSGDDLYGNALFSNEQRNNNTIAYAKKYNLFEGLRRYYHIFKSIKRNPDANRIVFLSIDNSLFPIFCLLFYFSLRKRNIICIIHNNLDTLLKSSIKRLPFKIISAIFSIKYVVLTEQMRTIIDSILHTSSVLIHHPFYSPFEKELHDEAEKRIFLTLGRQASEFNNQGLYLEFQSALENYKGSISPELKIGLPEGVALNAPFQINSAIKVVYGFITSSAYLRYFSKATFFIFPDTKDKANRASGTLIDALSQGVIFIAPEKGHFKEFKNCGIFYKAGRLQDAILEAMHLTQSELENMRLNIAKKRKEYEQYNLTTMKDLLTGTK